MEGSGKSIQARFRAPASQRAQQILRNAVTSGYRCAIFPALVSTCTTPANAPLNLVSLRAIVKEVDTIRIDRVIELRRFMIVEPGEVSSDRT